MSVADPTGCEQTLPAAIRRYLDNAATSWPKPPEVVAAWEHAGRVIGAAAGRATYREAVEADGIRGRCRAAVARLLGDVDPQRVAFPAGATLGLNMAIHGLLGAGDHVIATAADHNATLRPLTWLADRGVIELSIVPCDGAGRVDPDTVVRAWRPATRLVTCSHASNVTGAVQDARALGRIVHDRDGLFLLDAAQSLGQIACTADGCDADLIVAPSHKWLLGRPARASSGHGPESTSIHSFRAAPAPRATASPCPTSSPIAWRRARPICLRSPDCWRRSGGSRRRRSTQSASTAVGWPPPPPRGWVTLAACG